MNALKSIKDNQVFQFIKALTAKLSKDDALPYAYQLSYSLMLAIFPFLIFLLSLVGFMNLDSERIIEQIQRLMPGEAFSMFEGIITEVTKNQNGALLSVSILTAIWSSAGGFKAFMKAMNKVHGLKEDRSFIVINLDALIMVIMLAVGIAGSLLLLVFFQPIISTIKSYFPLFDLGPGQKLLSFVLPLIFIFLLFLAFYIFVPARNVKVRHALPGAIFAAVAFMAASLGFQYYVANFANYSRFYGAMGAVVVLIFWLLLISIIMVVGGALNSLIIIKQGVRYPYWKSKRVTENEVVPEAIGKLQDIYRNAPQVREDRL